MNKEVDAWLIERYINSTLNFWCGKSIKSDGFTSVVNDATKFVFAGDASTVLSWLLDGQGRVAQHIWINGEHQ